MAPGLAQQQQLERQRLLAAEDEGDRFQLHEELPGIMQMQMHTEGSAASAPAGAWGDADVELTTSAGEERWADDMFEGMFDDE